MCSVQLELKWKRTKGTLCFLIQKFCDHLREELSNLWTMSLISPIKRSHCSKRVDHMKKESIDHPACQLMQVFSQRTCTLIEVRCTTGAHVVTVKSTLFVMDSASGWSPDFAPSLSMWVSQATINCATARCLPMLLSATVHISTSGSGVQRIIVVSGQSLVLAPSGLPSVTGCSLSISDHLTTKNHKRAT